MRRVLVADDEESIRSVITRMLRRMSCEVDAQCDGLAAARSFERKPTCWDALITDYLMPGMDGVQLIGHVRAKRPELPIVMITGSINQIDMLHGLVPDTVIILEKPFDRSSLLGALKRAGVFLENGQ